MVKMRNVNANIENNRHNQPAVCTETETQIVLTDILLEDVG